MTKDEEVSMGIIIKIANYLDCDITKPQPDDIIIDPAMGSAGFLIAAQNYLRKNHADMFLDEKKRNHFNNDMFFGNDMDRTMLRIGAMNMLLHGVDNPNISYRDSLSEQNTDVEKYSLVLANPPFKGSLDYEAVSADLLKVTKTKKTELLFLALFLRILKKGGRGAVIVPDGVLFGSSNAHKQIRKEIIDSNNLEAEADRKRTEQSFFVPVEDIVANDYDLSINKYKEVVYEKVEYEPTDVIMGKIEAIESEIQTEFAELKKLLNVE